MNNLLFDSLYANEVVKNNTPTTIVLYIISIVGILVGSYYLNKSKNVDYKNLSIKNIFLVSEALIILFVSFIFGFIYLVSSIDIIIFIYSNLYFSKKGINNNISDERELVKVITSFYIKFIAISLSINIVMIAFAGFSSIGLFFLYFLAYVVLIASRLVSKVKVEETYKLMSISEVESKLGDYDTNKLFRACFDVFIGIQSNLTGNTIDNVSLNLEPNMLEVYKQKQVNYLNKQEKFIMEDSNFISGGLIDYKCENGVHTFNTVIVFSSRVYTVNVTNGNVTGGSPQRVKRLTYLLDFNFENNVLKLANERLFKEE